MTTLTPPPAPAADAPLETWLDWILHLHPHHIDLGLTRIRQVAERLALLQPAPVVFTVAGTNGKGTTCRTLETILLAAGQRVGVYSSPHLLHYTERVRIQGRDTTEAALTAAFSAIEAQRDGVPLTYFEYGTLAALWLFREAKLDVVILEVGLGGRLDATNIIDSQVAVVTSIALDHTAWLGEDREAIGREKAGIFRADRPAVVGEPAMPDSLQQAAIACGTQLLARDRNWKLIRHAHSWDFCDSQGCLTDLPLPAVPLDNAATALAALRVSPLRVDEEAIRAGLRQAALPGRFQIVAQRPRVILDVAHNPHAAHYLAQRLAALPQQGQLRIVIGMLQDKDIEGTIAALRPIAQAWYCATLAEERGASADQLGAFLPQARQFTDVPAAFRAAMQDAAPEDTVVVCGSFHTVAAVMALREKNGNHGE